LHRSATPLYRRMTEHMDLELEATDQIIHVQHNAVIGYQPPDVHCYDAADEGVLRRVVDNDPDVAGLILLMDFTENLDDEVGHALVNNSHIQMLDLRVFAPLPTFLPSFCGLLALNRSIEHLLVRGLYSSDSEVDLFSYIAPFLAHNHNLRCIEVTFSKMAMNTDSIVSTLLQPRKSRLERIDFSNNSIRDTSAATLLNGFNEMPGLCYLLELCLARNEIGLVGCTALCNLLTNSKSNIQYLDLRGNCLDDECIDILIDALCKNVRSSVKKLFLGAQKYVTPQGWLEFTAFLSKPSCSLEAVALLEGRALHYGSKALASLAINKTLRHIDIVGCSFITLSGWRGFSSCLRASDSVLEFLEIRNSTLDDEGAVLVFDAMSENSSLRNLNASNNPDVTSEGWIQCLRLASAAEFHLEHIDFSYNNIDDEGVGILVSLLHQSSSVSSLSLYDNIMITSNGWIMLADILLPTSSSKLKELCIGRHRDGDEEEFDNNERIINDDVIIRYANVLASNVSLNVLKTGDDYRFSRNGWDALVCAVCDTSSIASTFNSNHTLQEFHVPFDDAANDIRGLVRKNLNKDKFAVARQKILDGHFDDLEAIIRIFGQMDVNFLPYAFSWMGRDRDGFSVMYYCLRYMSWMN
jgi:hypothetical protein